MHGQVTLQKYMLYCEKWSYWIEKEYLHDALSFLEKASALPFYEVMTDRLNDRSTNQPNTNRPTNIRTDGIIGKLHFQKYPLADVVYLTAQTKKSPLS